MELVLPFVTAVFSITSATVLIVFCFYVSVCKTNFSDGNLSSLQSKTMEANKANVAISHSDCSSEVSVTDIDSRCRCFACV